MNGARHPIPFRLFPIRLVDNAACALPSGRPGCRAATGRVLLGRVPTGAAGAYVPPSSAPRSHTRRLWVVGGQLTRVLFHTR